MSVTTDSLLCHGCIPANRKAPGKGGEPDRLSQARESPRDKPRDATDPSVRNKDRARQEMQRGFFIRSESLGAPRTQGTGASVTPIAGFSAGFQDVLKLELAAVSFSLVIAKFWSIFLPCFG